MPKLPPFLASAVKDLGLTYDARGLMPLGDARARVRAATVAERGGFHRIDGQAFQPTDFDYLWAALLSLETAEEFVTEASRLVWKFSPRGFDNIAPVERYGEKIVPWLARNIDAEGRVAPSPWCTEPCLLALPNKEALAELLRIRTRPPEDRERVRTWLRAHRDAGWAALRALAGDGNEAAMALVAKEAKRAAAPLAASTILDLLDSAASAEDDSPMPWPRLRAGAGHFELHVMRVIVARSRKGDDWGILFEVVQGDLLDGPDEEYRWPATIQQYRYGSRVPSGGAYLVDARPIGMHRVLPKGFVNETGAVPSSWDGIKVIGPNGKKDITLTDALVKKLALAPGKSDTDVEDWTAVMAIRARLAEDPDAFWTAPEALVKERLDLPDAEVVVSSDAFEHVSGPGSSERGKAARLPSKSKTFRSLAAALVKRDPALFAPGTPCNDWRTRKK
jgi:hypothetical protein